MQEGGCEELSTLFASSVEGRLFENNIEELTVSMCPVLKYLWLPKEGEIVHKKESLKFIFHKMRTLRLNRLREFRIFHPSEHVLEGPVLKRLELYDCGVDDAEGQPIYLLQQVWTFVLSCLVGL